MFDTKKFASDEDIARREDAMAYIFSPLPVPLATIVLSLSYIMHSFNSLTMLLNRLCRTCSCWTI